MIFVAHKHINKKIVDYKSMGVIILKRSQLASRAEPHSPVMKWLAHYVIGPACYSDTWACTPTEVSIIGTGCLTVALFLLNLDKSQPDLKSNDSKKRMKTAANVYVCPSFKLFCWSSSFQGHDESKTIAQIPEK